MVASSFQDRLATVERIEVAKILFEGVKNGTNPMSGVLAWRIMTADTPIIQIPNTCEGILYSMTSPNFEPQMAHPLRFMAIGSGNRVVEGIVSQQPRIVLGELNSPVEAHLFRLSIKSFIEHHNIDSVGGLYPMFKVRGNEWYPIPSRSTNYKQCSSEIEEDVELTMEAGQWVQRENVSGTSTALRPPWELMKASNHNLIFDYGDLRRHRRHNHDLNTADR